MKTSLAILTAVLLAACACTRGEHTAPPVVQAAIDPGPAAEPQPGPTPPAAAADPEPPPTPEEVAAFHAPVPK